MAKFISTFEAACKKLKREPKMPEFLDFPEDKRERERAAYELEVIVEANNGNVKMELRNTEQYKWHPIHYINKDSGVPRGFRLSFDGSDCDSDYALLGCRHACKSEELADFLGKNRIDLYEAMRS